MLEQVRDLAGVGLGAQEYLDDFWGRWGQIPGFWKLERLQSFREPDVPSWVAMVDGDWDRALELIEAMPIDGVQITDGVDNRRLRVVELPLSPYLQWEMRVLQRWGQDGAQDIRVIDHSALRGWEDAGPLAEVVILGDTVMYEVLYDRAGTHCGGRRIEDQTVIAACHNDLEWFWAGPHTQDLPSFFAREVAPLGPPDLRRLLPDGPPRRSAR